MGHEDIYKTQLDNWDEDRGREGREEIHESWFREDTVDFWRHNRLYEAARCMDHRSELEWLTVGDGRYGLDAIRIAKLGFARVLPTDINEVNLKVSAERGHFAEYRAENLEDLSFEDNSFDVTFCKEAYHHCPRAPRALSEMLRVSRHAVVLVEPRDRLIDGAVPNRKMLLRKLINRLPFIKMSESDVSERFLLGGEPIYEPSGNFVYSISSRELEKMALGCNYPALALKGFSDHYIQGCETEVADESSAMFREIKSRIAELDDICARGGQPESHLMAVIFKTKPDERTVARLRECGWYVKHLTRNPYLSENA